MLIHASPINWTNSEEETDLDWQGVVAEHQASGRACNTENLWSATEAVAKADRGIQIRIGYRRPVVCVAKRKTVS